jgi:hypothetical protein
MSGDFNALTISALILSMIGFGVPAGAWKPYQGTRDEIRQARFPAGRHIRQQRRALGLRDEQRLQLARFDLGHDEDRRLDRDVDPAR